MTNHHRRYFFHNSRLIKPLKHQPPTHPTTSKLLIYNHQTVTCLKKGWLANVKLRKEKDMIFFVKFAHSTNTQKYPNEINEQKKIFMSNLVLLTIAPVLRASCTEIAQK